MMFTINLIPVKFYVHSALNTIAHLGQSLAPPPFLVKGLGRQKIPDQDPLSTWISKVCIAVLIGCDVVIFLNS